MSVEPFYTFGQATQGVQTFGAANTGATQLTAVAGLQAFKIAALVNPEIHFGSLLLRYDVTAYNDDYLFYGLELDSGDHRIRRVDVDMVDSWAVGAWTDRETLSYN